jgi:hypothetical protein
MRPRKHLLLLAAFVGCLVFGAPSPAQGAGGPSTGVHINPSSPAANEYALPLQTARGAPPSSGKTAPLFGSGIKQSKGGRRRSGGSSGQAGRTSGRSSGGGRGGGRSGGGRSGHPHTGKNTHRSNQHRATGRHPKHSTAAAPSSTTTRTTAATPTARKILHAGSGSSWLWMLIAGVAVLVLGSGGAFVLQHENKLHPE